MGISKVVYGGDTLIDLTGDSVTPETLAQGVTAHDASGQLIVGTMTGGGGGGDPNLPTGYTRCDYIQFTGTQIVDTGVICNQDSKIQLAFTREKSTQHYVFGVSSSGNTASVTAYLGGNFRFGNKSATKTPNTNADMIYSAVLSSSEITISDSKTSITDTNAFETVGTLLIGTCRSASGAVGGAQFAGKVIYFSIKQGGTQVLKLIPVTDGTTYRFYDTVSGTFFDSVTDTPLDGGNL